MELFSKILLCISLSIVLIEKVSVSATPLIQENLDPESEIDLESLQHINLKRGIEHEKFVSLFADREDDPEVRTNIKRAADDDEEEEGDSKVSLMHHKKHKKTTKKPSNPEPPTEEAGGGGKGGGEDKPWMKYWVPECTKADKWCSRSNECCDMLICGLKNKCIENKEYFWRMDLY